MLKLDMGDKHDMVQMVEEVENVVEEEASSSGDDDMDDSGVGGSDENDENNSNDRDSDNENLNDNDNDNGSQKSPNPSSDSFEEQPSPSAPNSSVASASPKEQLNDEKKKTTKATPSKRKTKSLPKSYVDYIHDAIVGLNNRAGSSLPAITKYLLATYPELDAQRLKARLVISLKSGIKAGRFDKIRASYKIGAAWKKKEREKREKQKRLLKAKEREKEKQKKLKEKEKEKKQLEAAALAKKDEASAKKEAEKKAAEKKAAEKAMDPTERKIQQLMKEDPLKNKELIEQMREDQRKKKELAEKKKEQELHRQKMLERMKKRRFPMEDTELHAQDKEFGIKPPKDLLPRPTLPFLFPKKIAAAKCDNLEYGSRGLVPDLLQVYHFFCGDVQYNQIHESFHQERIVPRFTLKNLIYAAEEILNGNAKKSRMVPPLIVHLFCACLRVLLHASQFNDTNTSDADPYSIKHRQLQQDFELHLAPALSPASWADVCHMYMDAMERYYTTEVSVPPNVLPGLPIDAEYLLYLKDDDAYGDSSYLTMAAAAAASSSPSGLPQGYTGYLGDPNGVLSKAQTKLGKQDPWLLSAEEIFAVLRVLTDDVLASQPEVGQDIASRKEEMVELHRAKRLADTKFRKVRLAFEGPKRPSQAKKKDSNPEKSQGEDNGTTKDEDHNKITNYFNKNNNNGSANVDEEEQKEDATNTDSEKEKTAVAPPPVFKPTATKKQFEAAEKAQKKANDAYEKGLRDLIARTEPVGYDRYHNAVYCFRHDPEALYVEATRGPSSNDSLPIPEEMKPNRSSWHVIETKSLFDQYASSLDIRGKRENALYEEILGPPGTQQSLKRFLFDDVKEKNLAIARLKEKEDLKRRLENARLKCDEEEGRRSGRLAGKAEDELVQIEEEIEQLEKKIKFEEEVKGEPADYEDLTGLSLLRNFDTGGDIQKKRTTRSEKKEQKEITPKKIIQLKPCSKLYSTGNSNGTGVIAMLVSEIRDVEKLCESLVPWEREDVSRKSWISDLDSVIHVWNDMCPNIIGPPEASTPSLVSSPGANVDATVPDSKRRKTENGSILASLTTPQLSQIVARLKSPLLDLEERVFGITGLSVASRDADLADDNMSDDGKEDETEKEHLQKIAWKKCIHKLRSIPTKRHGLIREVVVEAIVAARKAHLADVVAQLRAALLEYHPAAAFTCKSMAIKVLESNGGYDDDEDENNGDADDEVNNNTNTTGDAVTSAAIEDQQPSALSADAIILNSSLEGMEDASRLDWKNAVKSGRTVSRIATLVIAFAGRATEKLKKLQIERERLYDSLEYWEKEERSSRKRGGKPKKVNNKNSWSPDMESSEVWANVCFTDEICMAKVEDPTEEYPWWPAKKCLAKDSELAKLLTSMDRDLVSLVGERGGLRVVKKLDLQRFTGKAVEKDLSAISKDLRTQLDDCLAMSRRILRGGSKKKVKKVPDFVEEKKMST